MTDEEAAGISLIAAPIYAVLLVNATSGTTKQQRMILMQRAINDAKLLFDMAKEDNIKDV